MEDLYWRRIPNGSQPQPRPTEVGEAVPVHIPGKNAGAEKGLSPGKQDREEAALAPHTEGVPGPQDDIDPHLPFSTERKKR